jgi:hypothetical protein
MASRFVLPLAAVASYATAAFIPRNVPGVLSFPVVQQEKITLIGSKRAADTDIPVLNVSSTSYLMQRKEGPKTTFLGADALRNAWSLAVG